MFIHHVYFWLKPAAAPAGAAPASDEAARDQWREQLIADCRKYLGGVPSVRHLWAGAPAMTPREVVDNSYDVGLCVVLDDVAGHDVYQEHPLHKEFIERNKEHWDRVRIYDFKG